MLLKYKTKKKYGKTTNEVRASIAINFQITKASRVIHEMNVKKIIIKLIFFINFNGNIQIFLNES